MAIYDLGTASLSANGEVTGVGTTWKAPLTLIRVGATIVFKTEPVQIYTISEIISDTQINVYNPNSETVPAGTGYAILAHDGITVQGLAQDVAETLRYYQSRETEVAAAVDAFNNFDADVFQNNVNQVNTQSQQVSNDAAQVSSDKDQVSADKDSAASSAASALSYRNAAEASAAEAADSAASLNTSNLLRVDMSLSDLTDKALSRNNLDVYSKGESDALINIYSASDGFKNIGAYPDIQSLRSATPEVGDVVMVKEHTIGRGNDGGGVFVAKNGTVTDDDGFFVSSAASGVYWERVSQSNSFKIEWFGAKVNDQTVDTKDILRNAILHESRTIEFKGGSYYFSRITTIKPGFVFSGSGGAKTFFRNINLFADEAVFYANTGSTSAWAEDTIFEKIHFSNDSSSTVSNPAIVLEHVSRFKFNNCGFYNAPIYASDLHWVTWNGCTFTDSKTSIDSALVSESFPINEGPSFIDCFMVRSPIDLVDVADFRMNATSMFYGPYGVKITASRPMEPGADSIGFPVFITNSVIDNIDGYCLDFNRVALGTITNSLFSGGRISNTEAIRLTEILGLSFNANVIHYAGLECIYGYDCQNMMMAGNQFSGCNGAAMRVKYCRNVSLSSNFFGTQKVTGGWNTCTSGVNFDDTGNAGFLFSGNSFKSIPGVIGNMGSGRSVYTAAANSGLADN